MSVVSRRPHVTVVAKRDTSNEHIRVANNLKRKEGTHSSQKGEEEMSWQRSKRWGFWEVCMVGKSYTTKLIRVEVQIYEEIQSMEVYTGVAVSLISYQQLKRVSQRIKIKKTTVVLRMYTTEIIPVRGEVQVNVKIPLFSNLFSSCSMASLSAKGTVRGRWNLGVAFTFS